jgi:hypothetical protein
MSTTSIPVQPSLTPTTIIPENRDLFISYQNRTYEDIANTVNDKVNTFYPVAITSTPTNILNLPTFGAFILAVSAEEAAQDGSWPPTITVSLCKSSNSVAGVVSVLGSQAGQGGGVWGGKVLTVTSTATNFQIAHNATGVSGNFNIMYIGTQ